MTDVIGLRAQEQVIENALERVRAGFREVGEALRQIRDERLYRSDYSTFEAYCRERWGFSRPRAYQLIEAAEVSTRVDTDDAPPPATEKVARALSPLRHEPEKMREAWAETVDRHGDQPTAPQTKAVVDEHLADSPASEPQEDEAKGPQMEIKDEPDSEDSEDSEANELDISSQTMAEILPGETLESVKESISYSWCDNEAAKLSYAATELSSKVKKHGLVYVMSDEEMLELMEESEVRIADLRAAVQERIRDKAAA